MPNEMEKLVMEEFNENFYSEFSKDLISNLKMLKDDINSIIELVNQPAKSIEDVDCVVKLLINLTDGVSSDTDFYRLRLTERLNDLCNMENSFKYATKRIK